MTEASQPLLFFDTGVGGLSVFAKAREFLPQSPVIYAADYAGIPYGEKSEMEVATRVCALLGRLSERYRPRLAVIACNTASVIALAHVRAVLGIPIVGTVPAIKPASLATKTGVFGLLGTKATIRQPYVDRLEAEFAQGMTMLRHAAPELVAPAEAKMRGEVPDPAAFRSAMAGLLYQPQGDQIDTVVLGCTHFPLVETELAQAARDLGHVREIRFVDGAEGIAHRIVHLTEGQAWPEKPAPGLFVTTGASEQILAYRPALAEYGLTKFATL
ncbi:MAG: glutamate racemase [Sphingorhabdus sp.]